MDRPNFGTCQVTLLLATVVIKEDIYRKLGNAVPESDFPLHEFQGLIPFE